MAAVGVPPADSLLVHVGEDLRAADLVRDRLTQVPPPPAALAQVSVSRLVNPGRAYYDLVHPLVEDLAAHQKRLAGSGAHDLLEASLAAGVQFTELWLHGEESPGDPPLERIVGRLDACEVRADGRSIPTELKNVGQERELPSDEHLEQLGMYCALMGVDEGRIVAVHRDDVTGSSRLLLPWRVRFPDMGRVRATMAQRRDALTEAFDRKDPSGLPACPWWEMLCAYRTAGICDCGGRPKLDAVIAHEAVVERDPEYLELLRSRAASRESEREAKDAGARLSLYAFLTPRKTYFAARARPAPEGSEEEGAAATAGTAPVPTSGRAAAERSLARVNTRGIERQVFGAVLRAHGDRARFVSVQRGTLTWSLPVVDGRPFLVRVRHVARALGGGAPELAGNWGVPDDVRQLALRASLLGVDRGTIYVWNWKVQDPQHKLQVFEVTFDPEVLSTVQRYAESLPGLLDSAVQTGDHRGLPLCPQWMCTRCEFAPLCQPERG